MAAPNNTIENIQDSQNNINLVLEERRNQSFFVELQETSAYKELLVPEQTALWLKDIERKRVAIITPNEDLDIFRLMRYLAIQLSAPIDASIREPDKDFVILNLANQLEREAEKCVFIFDNQTPESVGYDIDALYEVAERKGFFILIGSSLASSSWRADTHFLLNTDGFNYPRGGIKNRLRQALQKNLASQGDYTQEVLEKLDDEAFIDDLANRFSTPFQVDLFAQNLMNTGSTLTERGLDNAIQTTLDKKGSPAVRTFKLQNDYRKMIALGLILFDGLHDDQFFGAMSVLVGRAWGKRNPQLHALDYCDLEAVSNFFDYNTLSETQRYIQNKSSDQRINIIGFAWDSYRRHLLSALPVLAQLAIDSVTRENSNWELFGTREKRIRLRSVISETISDLGLQAPEAVEHTLMQLAASDEWSVQMVAARAMSRWRKKNAEALLFKTIDRWQNEPKFATQVARILEEREGENYRHYHPIHYLRATAVLALGQAAAEDSPGHLNEKIITLFETSLQETNQLVKSRHSQIVPEIVERHLKNLLEKKLLTKFIAQDHLIYPVAFGIARAYYTPSNHPVVEQLFDSWLPKINKSYFERQLPVISTIGGGILAKLFSRYILRRPDKPETETGPDELSAKDRIAITLILTCQELLLQPGQSLKLCGMTPMEILVNFRQKEKNSIVLTITLNVLTELLHDFKGPEAAILVPGPILEREKQIIAQAFGQRYLRERHQLKGGDEYFWMNRKKYTVWTDGNRPSVAIDEITKKWLIYGNKDQKQIAILALAQYFHLFERQESRFIQKIREDRIKKMQDAAREALTDSQTMFEAIKELLNTASYNLKKFWITAIKSAGAGKILADISPTLREGIINEEALEIITQKLESDPQIPAELIDGLRSLHKIS